MKIRSQALLLALTGLLVISLLGIMAIGQIENGNRISREMQFHQQGLIQLNRYQISAINQILLSVDLIRTGDISGERITAYRMSETGFSRKVKELENLYDLSEELKPQIIELQASGKNLSELCKTRLMEPLYSHKPLEEGIIEKLIYETLPGIDSQINMIRKTLDDTIRSDLVEQMGHERLFKKIYMPAALIILSLLLGANYFIIHRAVKYINRTRRFLGNLAEGNSRLDVSMPERGNDEITYLRKNFNKFMKNLSDRYESLKNISSDQVSSGEKLNRLALEQAAALQLKDSLGNMNNQAHKMSSRVSSSQEEVRHITQALNSLGTLSGGLEDRISDMAAQGEQIETTIISQRSAVDQQVRLTQQVKEESMNSRRILELLKKQIEEILNQSGTIASSILSIQDLAGRTDVLAINASIEAAHSGQYGKGFAVVADEMRHLSGQVRNNASTISELLNELNSKLYLMADEEEENQKSLDELIKQNVKAEEAIERLQTAQNEIKDVIINFFNILKDVRKGSVDLHSETELVRKSSRRITSLMNELNSDQGEMLGESEEMTQGIEQFSRGTKVLEELSESNSRTAGYLEEEINRLGSE